MSPVPVPVPGQPPNQPPPVPGVMPYFLRERQDYAVEQERQRHNETLYAFGEYAIFVLLWRAADYDAGRVARCSVCFGSDPIASVYQQPSRAKCPSCFGTTYEGGYKARLVRPSIWDSNEEDYRESARGEVISQTVSIQTTSDFRLRTGDYVFRADGARYQMRTMSSNELRTGFAMPTSASSVVGYNYGTVSREDETSVAYLIPPSTDVIAARLAEPFSRAPEAFADLEEIRGDVHA